MYRVQTSSEAKGQLKELKKIYETVIRQAIEDIKEDPFIGKPLSRDFDGRYSYRVSVYRIIYTINVEEKRVFIISAGHRSTVYQ